MTLYFCFNFYSLRSKDILYMYIHMYVNNNHHLSYALFQNALKITTCPWNYKFRCFRCIVTAYFLYVVFSIQFWNPYILWTDWRYIELLFLLPLFTSSFMLCVMANSISDANKDSRGILGFVIKKSKALARHKPIRYKVKKVFLNRTVMLMEKVTFSIFGNVETKAHTYILHSIGRARILNLRNPKSYWRHAFCRYRITTAKMLDLYKILQNFLAATSIHYRCMA